MNDMRLCCTATDHYAVLSKYIEDKPTSVSIVSYGLYAGITYTNQDTAAWGDHYKLITRDFIESLKSVGNVRMIIGISEYKSCKGRNICLECEKQYVKSLIRLLNHADAFASMQWKMTTQLHLNAYLFEYKDIIKCLIGSRNLSDSACPDISISLQGQYGSTVKPYIDLIWQNSIFINEENISNMIEEQGISSKGFKSVGDI